jgi:hypothetical protein
MSKKSFATQLFQGFVKSAVNQVGRDGGKVISNRVYDDQHSTPFRSTRGGGIYQPEVNSDDQPFFTSPIWLYPFLFIGSLILSPIGFLYHLSKTFTYFLLINKQGGAANQSTLLIKCSLHLLLSGFFAYIAYQIYQALMAA